jgi:hypothetical protein
MLGQQQIRPLGNGKFQTPAGVFNTYSEAMASLAKPMSPALSQPSYGDKLSNIAQDSKFGFSPTSEDMMNAKMKSSQGFIPQTPSGLMDSPQLPEPATAPQAGKTAQSDPSFFDRLTSRDGLGAIGSMMLAMSNNPNLARIGATNMQKFGDSAQANRMQNRTVKALRDAKRDDLADAVESGLLGATDAAKLLFSKPEAYKPSSTIGKLQQDLNNGLITPQQYEQEVQRLQKAGVNVNVGGDQTSELDKTLMKRTGEMFSTYLSAGDKAAALIPELATLEQLASMAPNGPIQGRLAEAFPEFNNASAAFMSAVQRLAPTMRVEGSGSTSDIEFNAMLRSLGSLRNTPEANKMIYDAFRKKALLDQARAETVRMYQSKQITLDEAQSKLGKLNSERILSDDLRGLVDPDSAMTVEIPEQAPQDLPQGIIDLWPNMTESQKRKFL